MTVVIYGVVVVVHIVIAPNDLVTCTYTAAKIPLHFGKNVKQWRKTEQAIAAWMKDWQPPIGVSVGPDQIGRFVIQMCHNRGWQVP